MRGCEQGGLVERRENLSDDLVARPALSRHEISYGFLPVDLSDDVLARMFMRKTERMPCFMADDAMELGFGHLHGEVFIVG